MESQNPRYNETKIDFQWSVEPLDMEISFQLVTKIQQGLDFGPWCVWYQDGLEGQFLSEIVYAVTLRIEEDQ